MPTPGNWNIGPVNLPDFGITEKIFGPQWGNAAQPQAGLNTNTPMNRGLQTGGILGAMTAASPTPMGGQQYPGPIGPQPNPNPGGGGNPVNTSNQSINPGSNYFWDAADGWKQINPGTSNAEIDNAYSGTMNVLNQAESNLRGQLPGLISEAEAQAQASRSLLEGQRTTATEQLGQQELQAQQQEQRQTGQQRQILQELQQANQARFGGASSAGMAASELQGREFQRSRAGIQQQAQQALQTISNERNRVERDFQQGLQQLEVNKQQAVNQLNRMFQDKLLEINSRRADTEAAKAQARLQVLQELRNQAFQIQVAEQQFRQELQLQAQSNMSQLSQVEQTYLSAMNQGQGAVNSQSSFTPTAIPGVQGSQQTNTASPYQTGYYSIDDENMTGQIRPSSTRDNVSLFAA